MDKIYAQSLVDRMHRGEIPFDEELYSEAVDALFEDIFFEDDYPTDV